MPADSGTIYLDGKPVRFNSPAESLRAGIAFIHQELNLINDLPVLKTCSWGGEVRRRGGRLDLEAMMEKTADIFRRMNIDLDPRAMVRDLDASYKQIVEICRAILMDASVIMYG